MISSTDPRLKIFKYALFMILHVETSTDFAHSLNKKMIDNYEKLGAGQLNSPKDESFAREVTNLTIDQFLIQKEDLIIPKDSFLNKFVKISEDLEKECDFDGFIRDRKEQEKIKMMLEI